jgi:hypothetical protein
LRALLEKIRTDTINSGIVEADKLFGIFGRVLANFLERWIYADTDSADLSSSWLNRHVIAHGMAPANINKQVDANRLIFAMDLLVCHFSLSVNLLPALIPSGMDQLDHRRNYIVNMLTTNPALNVCIQAEEQFLRENKNYFAPDHQYGIKDSFEATSKKIEGIMKTV